MTKSSIENGKCRLIVGGLIGNGTVIKTPGFANDDINMISRDDTMIIFVRFFILIIVGKIII